MKILVIGYGSMGRRRIRILREVAENIEIIAVDKMLSRVEQAESSGIKVYESLESALVAQQFDAAFVCTSPGEHAKVILRLIEAEVHIFTELNLVSDAYGEILRKAKEKNVILFLSSTLLYKKQIEIVKKLVQEQKKPLTYIYHAGQYLPDWHPWESYKDFFVGEKRTNGVRELLAIQLPWIINTFGTVDAVHTFSQKCTELDIDFPDCVMVSISHHSGHKGVFVADIVSRKPVTRLEIIGEDLHFFWDGHNDDLFEFDLKTKELKQLKAYEQEEHMEGYSDNIMEQPYKEEVMNFLSIIKGESKPRYSFEQDTYILSLIDEIEGIS